MIHIGVSSMNIISVTDIRRNFRQILLEITKTKKPVAIIQRSKPIAYLIDAESFELLQRTGKMDVDLLRSRAESLDRIARFKSNLAKNTASQEDSTILIRELREGRSHYE